MAPRRQAELKNSAKFIRAADKCVLPAAFCFDHLTLKLLKGNRVVVKTINERKNEPFQENTVHIKSPISRASCVVAATDLIVHIRQHLPILLGTRSTIHREHPSHTAAITHSLQVGNQRIRFSDIAAVESAYHIYDPRYEEERGIFENAWEADAP